MVMEVDSLQNLGVLPCPLQPNQEAQEQLVEQQDQPAEQPAEQQDQPAELPAEQREQPAEHGPDEQQQPKPQARRCSNDPFQRCPFCSWAPEGAQLDQVFCIF